jgi:hypothetical protein
MDLVNKSFLMETIIKEGMSKHKLTGKANTPGKMEQFMKDNLLKATDKAKV